MSGGTKAFPIPIPQLMIWWFLQNGGVAKVYEGVWLGSSIVLEVTMMGQLLSPIAAFRASWPLVARTGVVE
jgi:hypothetical protein